MTKLEESPKPGPEESSIERSCASDDSDVSSCSDDPENVEVERDPILNEKGVSVSKVVTGEGTENKVSLEPSLFINCDRDNAVVVEEFADVGVKGPTDLGLTEKQVKETCQGRNGAFHLFDRMLIPDVHLFRWEHGVWFDALRSWWLCILCTGFPRSRILSSFDLRCG
ncbi:hypothetical protein U1Q18_040588 [Sarracenia purpurea var. burkii]